MPVVGQDQPAAAGEPAAGTADAPTPAPSPAARAPVTIRDFSNRSEDAPVWPWVLGGILLLGVLGLAGLVWWRRRPLAGIPLEVPQLERPKVDVPPAPVPQPLPESLVPIAPAPPQQPATMSAEPLQVTLEPLRLSLTLMNATLDYRLEVSNRGSSPITGLTIGADMISAHASMSREEQLAGPGRSATAPQSIERLEPGESKVISGAFRVPFSQIVPIRQGSTALLLPLARFRVEAEGSEPVVRTFVVGQPGEGSALQPFRLDLGPRIYPHLAQRAFA
ncbi:MAG: hypothetical protein J7493_17210 [Porphyrobacter sp.]|nr:hypothetical protein [Porphyrobacter sp.]